MGFERNGIGVLKEHTACNRVREFLWGSELCVLVYAFRLFLYQVSVRAANRMEVGKEKEGYFLRASGRLQMCTSWRRNWGLF